MNCNKGTLFRLSIGALAGTALSDGAVARDAAEQVAADSGAGAQDGATQRMVRAGRREKSVHIVRADTPPVIDGVLEEVWSDAAIIDDLHEIQPTEYSQPTEPTLIYLLYDDDALYVGARLFDSEPGLIIDRIMRQGDSVFGDDWFEVALDSFHDRRSGYRFLTNPNGVRQDGLYQNVSETQWEWQSIWRTASSINDEGWIAEIAIPFKSLSFDPDNGTWGINFRRALARRDEQMGWVSRNRNTDPSTSGVAVGFEGLQQGMGLDVVPSISIREQQSFAPSASDFEIDPSLDVFHRITPSVTASLTINTDFSATDVDDRRVNLTRFDLFFPEKRDFFLQDADVFEFGGLDENGRPFFSRRIGLSATGEPVDIDVGGKLSGQLGRFNFGVLAIRQDEFGVIDAGNAIVLRGSANVLAESTLGVILTHGNPGSNLDNSVHGIDFAYRNTRLPGGRLLEADVWAQRSDTEGGGGGGEGAYGIGLRSPNSSGIGGRVGFERFEENFNPGLGFVNRRGVQRSFLRIDYTYRPAGGYLRSIQTAVFGERTELISGGLQSRRISLDLVELESRRGDWLALVHSMEKEVLLEPFEISEGIVLPAGAYSFDESSIEIQTADHRKVWGDLELHSGEFFSGNRTQLELGGNWRPSRRFMTRLSYEVNDIELPQGDFTTRLAQFRTEVVFSSTLSWVTLAQYDNVSEIVGINSRVHWIPKAGREAFLVLNHKLQDFDRDNRFHSQFSEAAVKFNYTFRF